MAQPENQHVRKYIVKSSESSTGRRGRKSKSSSNSAEMLNEDQFALFEEDFHPTIRIKILKNYESSSFEVAEETCSTSISGKLKSFPRLNVTDDFFSINCPSTKKGEHNYKRKGFPRRSFDVQPIASASNCAKLSVKAQQPKRPDFRLLEFKPLVLQKVSAVPDKRKRYKRYVRAPRKNFAKRKEVKDSKSSDEDLDDDIVKARHDRCEVEEKRKHSVADFSRERRWELEAEKDNLREWDEQFEKNYDQDFPSWNASLNLDQEIEREWKIKPNTTGDKKEDWEPACFLPFPPRQFPISEAELASLKEEDDGKPASRPIGG